MNMQPYTPTLTSEVDFANAVYNVTEPSPGVFRVSSENDPTIATFEGPEAKQRAEYFEDRMNGFAVAELYRDEGKAHEEQNGHR